jgi:anti-sigma factor RsiW
MGRQIVSCPAFEERVARYVGGDLAREEALAVERHLRSCAGCAELARGLEEDRMWISSRPPETSDIDYAAIRQRIRHGIAAGQRRSRRWLPGLLAAAAMTLAVAMVMVHRAPKRLAVTALVAHVAPADLERAVAEGPAVMKKRRSRTKGPGVRPANNSEAPQEITLETAIRMFQELEPGPPEPPPGGSDSPVEMQLSTGNPNVTIILLQESKGDSQ